MDERSNRANQVWSRLAGCFGEALARKFGDEPPPEWSSAIGELTDYDLQRGMRRLKYSGLSTVPSLPQFLRMCREVGGDSHNEAPTTANALPAPEWNGDKWDQTANLRLLSFILKNGNKRRYFDSRETAMLVAFKKKWAALMRAIGDDVTSEEMRDSWNGGIHELERQLCANVR